MKIGSKYKGILYIVLSAFCFALMNMFVRMAGDLPSIQKSFFRNIVAAAFACIVLLRNHVPFKCKKENLKFLVMRAGFGTLGVLFNFYAIDHLLLADASMLNKMSPFFAVIFSMFILKEKVNIKQALIIVGAFAGSLFVIKPTFLSMDLLSSVVGLLGGMFAGLAYTMVRKLGMLGEKGPFIVFFFSTFSCVVLLPWLIFDYHPMTLSQVVILLLAGLSAAGGQFSITAAYCYAPAKEISVYDYSQIIFAAALGFFVFGQMPDVWSWIGYAIICTMAVINFKIGRSKV